MSEATEARATLEAIEARLERQPHWPELRAAHLDLVTAVGQLQGAVSERRRERGETAQVREAEAALDRLKRSARQVGMDIRLASEGALLVGLQATLEEAWDVVSALDRVSP